MKYLSYLYLILIFSIACTAENGKQLPERYKSAAIAFSKSEFPFESGNVYFKTQKVKMDVLMDSLRVFSEEVFDKDFPKSSFIDEVHDWLYDSVYFAYSRTIKGYLALDTTNLNQLDNWEEYYHHDSLAGLQPIYGTLLSLEHNRHSFSYEGNTIYMSLEPANRDKIKDNGRFRIEASGGFYPLDKNKTRSGLDRSNFIYQSTLYKMDWFLCLRSDHYFDGLLCIQLPDTCEFFKVAY